MKVLLDESKFKVEDYDKDIQFAIGFSMIPLEAKRIVLYLIQKGKFKGKVTEFMKEININSKYLATNFHKLGVNYCVDNKIVDENRLSYQEKELTLNPNYKENIIKLLNGGKNE